MPETLDLAAHGWKVQREYEYTIEWQVAEDERELGNVTTTAIAEKGLNRLNVIARTDQQSAEEYARSFFLRTIGPVARFYFPWPEFVPSPDAAPVLTAVVAGAQAERTITLAFAWRTATGTTRPSPTGQLVVPEDNLIHVALPIYPASVSEAVIYASDTAGTLWQQAVLDNLRTWTQPDEALLIDTTAVETTNGATEAPLCRLVEKPRFRRGVGRSYELSLVIEEAY